MPPNPKTYTFKFVKAPDFKILKVDGAYGGITIKGEINANFYIDTIELPKTVLHAIGANGVLQKEIPLDRKPESFRELTSGLIMDVNVAKSFVIWLNERITEAEALIANNNEILSKL
jgi:hypothetical protein